MAFEFKLPDIGEGVVEGEIVKWLVKPGDRIEIDQPMVEVMTDKATVVIPSPKQGTVLETRGKEGEIAKVHGILVVIEEGGAKAAAPAPAPAPAAPVRAAAPAPAAPVRAAAPAAAPAPVAAPAPAAPRAAANGHHPAPVAAEVSEAAKVLAAPATRRLARELGVELRRIAGTGPAGRVTSEDVRRAVQPAAEPVAAVVEAEAAVAVEPVRAPAPSKPRAPVAAAAAADERIPVRGLRKRIWENMAQSSFTAAHFTFVEECDMTELVKTRDSFNARLKEGEDKLTFLPFIIKAVISSLKRFPDLNAHVDDDAMEYVRRGEYHVGVATASERGLIVPVVRHADRRSILGLAQEIKRLGDSVRKSQVQQSDLGGSTFTITSLGKDGGIFATPIINYPEVAIMGIHKITKRPVVKDDQIVIRDMMNLSLSFDHRLIDGHVGAAFTYAVIRLLEDPERLMMEMA